MLRRWLTGLAILITMPLWVPPVVIIGLPWVIGDILRREWQASIWERRKRDEFPEND